MKKLFLAFVAVILFAGATFGQTSEFTYQGKLTDTGTPSATYDFEFRLCDSLADDCTAPLAVQQISGVPVSGGVFTVKLDFTAANFDGSDRFLEIAVKRPAQADYTTLAGRQKITSAPYAIKSISADAATSAINADNAANSTLFGGLTIDDFVQNTTTQQTGNFNLSGDGILGSTLGVGVTTPEAGYKLDVSGLGVFRPGNGRINLGSPSGETGMAIISNSPNNRADIRFDGTTLKLLAGTGTSAMASTNGINIDRFGNVGIGTTSPNVKLDVTGSVNLSGILSVGTSATINNLNAYSGVNVVTGNLGVFSGNLSVSNNAAVSGALTAGNGATVSNGLTVSSGNLNVSGSGSILNVGSVNAVSGITLGFVPNGGDYGLCYKVSTKSIANCSASSLRYKRDVETLEDGLSIVNRLRPIRFNWKEDGRSDIGFAAEEVEKIEPLLTFRSERGEVEGVKYQLMGVVLVKAVKEQQTQIEQQNEQIKRQQTLLDAQQKQIDDLKKLVCSQNPQAEICKER